MGNNLEPMAVAMKQAGKISLGILVVFALIGLIPATNAYHGDWGYWVGALALCAFIFLGFFLGTKLSRPKGFKE